MLNIFIGREDIDKQRYMFTRIKREDLEANRKRPIYLVVPDQFTLETERSAFGYMDVPAFINPIVLSMNRLAGKALAEVGERTGHIDRYGNYMLLARLLYRKKGRMELYRDLEGSTTFIAQLSEAIMSLKSHLVTPDELAKCAEEAEMGGAAGTLLGKKLRDVAALYAEYEAALADGLPDSTDITRRFVELIPGSKMLKDSVVWVFGFDYFSPLYLEAFAAMAARASEVNVVLTADRADSFFSLTNNMAEALRDAAERNGAKAEIKDAEKDAGERGIDCAWLPEDEKPGEIAHIERELFAGRTKAYAGETKGGTKGDGSHGTKGDGSHCLEGGTDASPLRLVVAHNYYNEAEAAARAIVGLIRDEGLRFRDILVVCNDQGKRASAIRRVFGSFGIETFLDKRHDVGFNPAMAYIIALPEIVSRGCRTEDVLKWLGTGLTEANEDDVEELENYTARYSLRGNAWQKPLRYGAGYYDEDVFARIGDTVKYVGDTIARFAERFSAGGGTGTGGDIGTGTGTGIGIDIGTGAGSGGDIGTSTGKSSDIEIGAGTGKGNRKGSGFSISKAPASARARTEGLRAFLEEDARLPEKIAAYADRLEADGLLEYAAHMRGIWDVALSIFSQISAVIGDVKTNADEYATILRVGFSSVLMGVLPASSDCVTIGTMQRTRTGRVKAMFVLGANDGELPMFAEDNGLLDDSEKECLDGLGLTAFRREESLHYEEQLAIYKNLSKPTKLLYLSYTGFSADGKDTCSPSRIFERLQSLFPDVPLEKAGEGDNKDRPHCLPHYQNLGPERMRALLPQALSPTSVEQYSRCPFAFLMGKGLKLGEIRKYEVDSLGMGEVYHEALRRFGEKMIERGGAPANEKSAWNTATRAETDDMVSVIFREIEEKGAKISPEAALLFDKSDPAAVYREERLQSTVRDICWALTEQARGSGIERMLFETSFEENKEIGAMRIAAGAVPTMLKDGNTDEKDMNHPEAGLDIEGRIDRIDILPGGRARVVDYKSGRDTFSFADVKSGWQLQLMLYLLAIEKNYIPAGVSYFRLFEPSINLTGDKAPATPEEVEQAILKEYRSDGILVDDSLQDNKDRPHCLQDNKDRPHCLDNKDRPYCLQNNGDGQGSGQDSEQDEAQDNPKNKNRKKSTSGEKLVSEEELNSLTREVESRLADIALALATGEAPAAPLQKAGSERITACTYCDYLSICNFEK